MPYHIYNMPGDTVGCSETANSVLFFILEEPFAMKQMFTACSQRLVSVGKTIDFPLVLQRFQVGRSMIVQALVMQCPRPKQVDPPACSWQYVQLAGENHVSPMVFHYFEET